MIDTREEEKNATMWTSLPQVQQFLGLGWHRHLPAEAGVTFTSVAILGWSNCKGEEMWKWLEIWHDQAQAYEPDPQQACAKEDVERRFAQEHGKPYDRSLRGIVDLLIELGLVYKDVQDGEEILKIPDLLPLPEDCLTLSRAERDFLEILRAGCPY